MNAPTAKPLDLSQFDGHTPGPWITPGLDDCNDRVVCTGHGKRRTIAHVYGGSDCFIKAPARDVNGELIAAAPALLAECKRQRERIAELETALSGVVGYVEQTEAGRYRQQQARDALAPKGTP